MYNLIHSYSPTISRTVHTYEIINCVINVTHSTLRHFYKDLEACFFCLQSIQDGIPIEENDALPVVFGPEVLGKIPVGNQQEKFTDVADLH